MYDIDGELVLSCDINYEMDGYCWIELILLIELFME